MSVLKILEDRGFVQQSSGKKELDELLSGSNIVFYAGFDPTADSLHIGSLVPIMAMSHLQRAGHTPIALIGGGTTLIGDPSGKTKERQLISAEEIDANGVFILDQLKRYLSLDKDKGIFVNNADWLRPLNYIEFLRDIGKYFRVNEMLRSESYRQRMEREEGLSFIEFNYQLLQAYDYLFLFDKHACILQMGGDDQWSNILAGRELIRRMRNESVHALTFPLITTARGNKMGKTEQGTIWLDKNKTSVYEFYQYWINTDDRDVSRFLCLFTFLDMEQIQELGKLQHAQLRTAKEILAFEATKLAHGEKEAKSAQELSHSNFNQGGSQASDKFSIIIDIQRINDGISAVSLFHELGLVDSKSEAKRLIQQGGAYINDQKIGSIDVRITEKDVQNGRIMLRKGKKQYCSIVVS